jgi:hypothetical protein
MDKIKIMGQRLVEHISRSRELRGTGELSKNSSREERKKDLFSTAFKRLVQSWTSYLVKALRTKRSYKTK